MPYLGEVMNRKYHVVMYHTKSWLWVKWHSDLRRFFDGGEHKAAGPRPWYHMCCIGGYPDWRTRFCDWLESPPTGWRYHEDVLYHLDRGDDE